MKGYNRRVLTESKVDIPDICLDLAHTSTEFVMVHIEGLVDIAVRRESTVIASAMAQIANDKAHLNRL
jgi:hypothetical protein